MEYNSLLRTDEELAELYQRRVDLVYRLCFIYLKKTLYLYYFEEYTVKEIAEMLEHKESTIQTQLFRGRKRLKMDLGGNYIE